MPATAISLYDKAALKPLRKKIEVTKNRNSRVARSVSSLAFAVSAMLFGIYILKHLPVFRILYA